MGQKQATARELQASVQAFVRRFGLLVTKQTPCGEPVSPSVAHALMALLDRDEAGQVTYQHELAELLGLDRSSITRLCARLESSGRLAQQPGAHDARSRVLRLTPSGRKLANNLRDGSLRRFVRIVEAIPASRRRPLLDALGWLTVAVATLEEEA
jgi:DNA-binding MarR family transcriptional regulator